MFEATLREHLSLAGTVQRIGARIPASAPDEQETERIASEMLAPVRAASAGRIQADQRSEESDDLADLDAADGR